MRTKRIAAQGEDAVWLAAGPLLWSRLKLSTKQQLLTALERVAGIRSRLAQKSKVSTMPPIEIVAELWTSPCPGIVHGCCSRMIFKGEHQFAVKLSASTAAIENEAIVEGILAHEFLHCFYWNRTVIAASRRGLNELEDSFDIHSREDDDAHLAPLADWFHEEITIPHHNDETCLSEVKKYFRELSAELPIRTYADTSPVLNYIAVPTDIRQHVECLLKSEQQSPT
jgi:hypothetical protein